MKRFWYIILTLFFSVPSFAQNSSQLDAYRHRYCEIIGKDNLTSNLTSATCPYPNGGIRDFSDTEFLSLLYDNPFTYYGITGFKTDLQKKMYKESDEFKQKNAEFVALRKQVLSKSFMVIQPLLGHYDIEKKKFEGEFKTIVDYNDKSGRFNLGCVSLYDPSIKVSYYVDKYVRNANLYQHVNIDVPSEEAALDIENNIEDCGFCVVFDFQKMKTLNIVIYNHYQIQGKPVKCCIVNTKYGFIYDSNWKASKAKAVAKEQQLLRQKEEAEEREKIRREEERVAALKLKEQTILDEINSGKIYSTKDLSTEPYITIPSEFGDRLNTIKNLDPSLDFVAVITPEKRINDLKLVSFSKTEISVWKEIFETVKVYRTGELKLPYSETYVSVPVKTNIGLIVIKKSVLNGIEVKLKFNKKLNVWQVQNSKQIVKVFTENSLGSLSDKYSKMIQDYFSNYEDFSGMEKEQVICKCNICSRSFFIKIENFAKQQGQMGDAVEFNSMIKPLTGKFIDY